MSWTIRELEDGRIEVITDNIHYIIDENDNVEVISRSPYSY